MIYNIRVLNSLSPSGLAQLNNQHYQLCPENEDPHGILVRSFDMHNLPIPDTLEVVGRAGVGTNNIPVDALTAKGIPVLNTPGANANAVKELVITSMLIASRNICSAWEYVKNMDGDDEALHERIEKEKKQFRGFELPGKTLAVIGLGKIGVKVANAAYNLGMHVIGYDPSITVRSAWELSPTIQQAESLNEALKNADFVTLHMPLNDHTYHLIDHDRLQIMKQSVVLLNFARGEIVDNDALARAISHNQVRYYVCDFPSQQFANNPQVISLPHLGASTHEAEENCAVMIAKQMRDYLEHGHITHAINFPDIVMPHQEGFRLTIANANVPNMVAQISTVLSNENINIMDMINKSKGEIAYTLFDLNKPITDFVFDKILNIEGVLKARRISPV